MSWDVGQLAAFSKIKKTLVKKEGIEIQMESPIIDGIKFGSLEAVQELVDRTVQLQILILERTPDEDPDQGKLFENEEKTDD